MADRLTEILENQIKQMQVSLAMMESGALKTHTNFQDTTDQGIEQTRVWIAELEEALARHGLRNA